MEKDQSNNLFNQSRKKKKAKKAGKWGPGIKVKLKGLTGQPQAN